MAVVKSVEYIEVSITASSEPVTKNLTKSQDEAQCVPFYSVRNTGVINDRCRERTGEVEFIDNGGTPAVRVSASARTDADTTIFCIYVVEFDTSINVQQVDVSGFTGTSVNVAITDVGAQTEAFLIFSSQFTASATDRWRNATVRARFNGAATDSVTLSRAANAGTVNGTLYAVDCDAGEFTVAHETITFTSTGGSTSETTSITTVVEADTFLVVSYESEHNTDDMLNGAFVTDLQDTTTIRARRAVSGSPATTAAGATIAVQVVEAQANEWDVQRNDALTLDAATKTDSITAIDQARSLVSVLDHTDAPNSVGRNDSTNGGQIDDIQSAADFSADNTVRFKKRTTTLTNDVVSYEVIPSPIQDQRFRSFGAFTSGPVAWSTNRLVSRAIAASKQGVECAHVPRARQRYCGMRTHDVR